MSFVLVDRIIYRLPEQIQATRRRIFIAFRFLARKKFWLFWCAQQQMERWGVSVYNFINKSIIVQLGINIKEKVKLRFVIL